MTIGDRLKALIQHGIFPKETIPAFNTTQLVRILPQIESQLGTFGQKSSQCCTHSIPKKKHLRRKLSIPNPLTQIRLSRWIASNWEDINNFIEQSQLSLSKPFFKENGEGLSRTLGLSAIASQRTIRATNSRYVLHVDLARYYSSIYTHSIAWAMHTKQFAKVNKGRGVLGNQLDKLVRQTQDDQTLGIPIGPDTSLVVSEIIGSALDQHVSNIHGLKNGFRYLDDYYLYFSDKPDAERALADISAIVLDFELELNTSKTKILELPVPLEPSWVSELRMLKIDEDESQSKQIISYFSKAFALQKENEDDVVLLYALNRITKVTILQDAWSIFESMLLSVILADPNTIRIAGHLFLDYYAREYPVDIEKIGGTISEIILHHARYGHGKELSWALWLAKSLNIGLNDDVGIALSTVDDVSTALIALDLRSEGLLVGLNTDYWTTWMTADHLYKQYWLFAYEANVKGWMTTADDYIGADDFFSLLRDNNVQFYNGNLIDTVVKIDAYKEMQEEEYQEMLRAIRQYEEDEDYLEDVSGQH